MMEPENLIGLTAIGVLGLLFTAANERGKERFSVKTAGFAALAAVYAAGSIGTAIRLACLP